MNEIPLPIPLVHFLHPLMSCRGHGVFHPDPLEYIHMMNRIDQVCIQQSFFFYIGYYVE